ncbi:MAG TPA: putative DNA-binding domain-containing protein [Xanthomonadales bacterium]|nr:putative DNA-binding domain-containing protein [Xanthomonadales bacterium]
MSNADAPESLAELQTAFAGHIRNPTSVKAPGDVEDRRMRVYRELFFNNINKFLAGNFPILRSLYDKKSWARLVRQFYIEHRAHTPLFMEIPKEFLRYVQEQRQGRKGDPPFLYELAHYESVDLALFYECTDLEQVAADPEGDVFKFVPVLSPLAWPLSYRYPVHRITPEFQPQTAPDVMTQLLAYRNRKDVVKFMELNEVTQLLLALMRERANLSGKQLLEQTAEHIKHPKPGAVVENGRQLLQDLVKREVILGTRIEADTHA